MGSMIHLAVGRLEIDWGKNEGFRDHSALFQAEDDVTQVPYYYAGEADGTDFEGDPKWKPIIELKEGLSKPLSLVIDRLNLLGHTSQQCEREFDFLAALNGFDRTLFRFQQLQSALAEVDVNVLSVNYGEGGEDFGKFFRREIAPRIGLHDHLESDRYEMHSVSEAMENLSAYTILQLLSRNDLTKDLPVQWAFSDIDTGGYAKRSDFVRRLDPANRFLIVTEGSSDAAILRQALNILRPHIADFFDFVDMEEGYPFSGTGNLFRFVQGLISISVQNKVLVVFDNDAEGIANYKRCRELNVPSNMSILKLPDLPSFSTFETIGPAGVHKANINGRGAAIECYLDLDANARVRWTGYNAKTETYHGELERKTRYMKEFLEQRIRASAYNYAGLEAILETITNSATCMREMEVAKNWESGD
ncbi:HEPN/Toprim-associated domain-containing protein [Reyranella massiliensis]|uniref:HEPN/Toprim-associated domain-containing protein n=1 Tax=Reyranella massiliensis TaxID=445220 RepID=UPI0006ACB645|nr:HEPN/Toprim-associated domain-containing protein [Reyranella massiliensis]